MRSVALAILLAALPLSAGRIDVSDLTQVTLRTGQKLEIEFSVTTPPAQIGFQAFGVALPDIAPAAIPGSTAEYYPGFLFAAVLESLDGAVSVPLFDPAAYRQGLPQGFAVMTPGIVTASGSERAAAVVGATAWAPPRELFGPGLGARIWLRNLGPDVVLGAGDGYSMRSSVTVTGVQAIDGSAASSGRVTAVAIANPEPATMILVFAGLLALAFIQCRTGFPSCVCERPRGKSRQQSARSVRERPDTQA